MREGRRNYGALPVAGVNAAYYMRYVNIRLSTVRVGECTSVREWRLARHAGARLRGRLSRRLLGRLWLWLMW